MSEFSAGIPAMSLTNKDAPMTNAETLKVARILAAGCTCGSDKATLTRRTVNTGTETIQIQCAQCGSSRGRMLVRGAHAFWRSYPLYNELRGVAYHAAAQQAQREAEAKGSQGYAERVQKAQAARDSVASYSDWLKTSPEWKRLRGQVMERAGRVCEACLEKPATIVHHLTYEYGVLPPSWELRAVCKECHDRIHADSLGRSDEWCMNPLARRRIAG